MSETKYTVERSIEDVEFTEDDIEEVRERVRKQLVEEGYEVEDITEDLVQSRVEDKLVQMVKEQTNYQQGDNRLTRKISYELQE